MALRALPIRQDPRAGTDDDRHTTYYCASCAGWFPASHFTTCEGGAA